MRDRVRIFFDFYKKKTGVQTQPELQMFGKTLSRHSDNPVFRFRRKTIVDVFVYPTASPPIPLLFFIFKGLITHQVSALTTLTCCRVSDKIVFEYKIRMAVSQLV